MEVDAQTSKKPTKTAGQPLNNTDPLQREIKFRVITALRLCNIPFTFA